MKTSQQLTVNQQESYLLNKSLMMLLNKLNADIQNRIAEGDNTYEQAEKLAVSFGLVKKLEHLQEEQQEQQNKERKELVEKRVQEDLNRVMMASFLEDRINDLNKELVIATDERKAQIQFIIGKLQDQICSYEQEGSELPF